jgi:hypothetical protein
MCYMLPAFGTNVCFFNIISFIKCSWFPLDLNIQSFVGAACITYIDTDFFLIFRFLRAHMADLSYQFFIMTC